MRHCLDFRTLLNITQYEYVHVETRFRYFSTCRYSEKDVDLLLNKNASSTTFQVDDETLLDCQGEIYLQ